MIRYLGQVIRRAHGDKEPIRRLTSKKLLPGGKHLVVPDDVQLPGVVAHLLPARGVPLQQSESEINIILLVC